jgi:hypothetical protein
VKKFIAVTDLEYFCNKSWTVSFNVNTKSWVSFHTYLPNFYIGENNFFYSGLNEGCNMAAVAVTEIPSPTTTTTTTTINYCNLSGTAEVTGYPCALEGTAVYTCALEGTADYVSTTTTTTTTDTFFNVDWRISEFSNTGQYVKLWYSIDLGATWTLWVTSAFPISDYPVYDVFAGTIFNQGATVYLAITDTSDNDIQYGVGASSGDFISHCGKSNPVIIPSINAYTIIYFNLNASAGNFVNCP